MGMKSLELKISNDSVLYTSHSTTSSTERADLKRVKSSEIKTAMERIKSKGKYFNNNPDRYYLLEGCVLRYVDNNGNIQIFYETKENLKSLINFLGLPYPNF
ncbi:hypothetical protein HY449_04435 [Candidatus Pacearchaeota archaeon]|nr:hypothetical protein [Candidatus Pacearchaeota archaeon]